jgi:WD40 repeat protein
VAFSPDGEWLASGSSDQTIRLWEINDPGAEPVVLSGHDSSVWSVAFSPDGEWLASGSDDRTIRLWRTLYALADFACEQAGRNFTLEEWGELLPGREYEITCPQFPAPGP